MQKYRSALGVGRAAEEFNTSGWWGGDFGGPFDRLRAWSLFDECMALSMPKGL
jgi:hypothetical protein